MNNSGNQQSVSDREVDDQQQQQQQQQQQSSNDDSSAETNVSGEESSSNGNDNGLAGRLTDLLVGDGERDDDDGDLLMQRDTRHGSSVMQWLMALDMQVMGACRADERLKPLLKRNASSVAEDRLLSHLSQHFEPSEVGLLARCLCIPLASVRVGKIRKQGTLLTPTSTRGNLVISLLPTSDLRISFIADDGYADTLSILRNISDCSSVMIERIPTDSSGRSFAVRIPNKDPFYFWCSEKSRLLGYELLEKMKNLLERKPSLAELTGISDSRFERFVHHLRTNSLGSNTASEAGQTSQSQNSLSRPSRPRSCNFQVVLSPRPSSFKLRRRTDGARIETSEKHPVASPSTSNHGKRKLLDSFSGTCLLPSLPMPSSTPTPQLSPPYYCWCPPVVSITTLQTEPFTLPPLSSLLPMASPNLSEIPILPLSMSTACDPIVQLPVIDVCSSGQAYLVNSGPATSVSIPPVHNPFVQVFPSLPMSSSISAPQLSSPYYCWCPPVVSIIQTEPFTLPPLSSLLPLPSPNLSEIPILPLSMSASSQVFTPLMCEPIVHLPVIDICSSGQAYLVNSGPTININIPPLHNPFVEETTESEKSARDTLRVLISGSGHFPSVVGKSDGNVISAMSLVSPGMMTRRYIDPGDLVETDGAGLSRDDSSEDSNSRK